MAARLRARAGADDARAASFYLARFACSSPHERIRAFTSGEDLIVCRFSLNQPAVTVYKVRFSKCATPVRAARFTFQNVLHCKSGLREIARANDAFVALTAQGVWTVPLGEVSARTFLLGPISACGLPWGGLVAAYNVCPGSWELLVNGKGPPICRVTCSTQHHLRSPDAGPVLWCARLLESQHHTRDDCSTPGSSLFLSKHLTRLLGLKPSDLPSQSTDAEQRGSCVLLLGLPDGRVLGTLLHSDRPHESCRARLVCDLGQPVTAISCWQPEHLENKDMEVLIIGARGKVLSSCSGTWLEAWTPNILEEAHDFCLNGALIHWLHKGTPWEAHVAIRQQSPQEAAFLQVEAGPLPLGKALSIQSLTSSVLTKLHAKANTNQSELNQDSSGLLILDGCGGVRLVSPLPPQRLSLQGLHPHPIMQAKNELLFVQAALQQLRQLQHRSITVTAEREDGRLVATFPDSGASNWIHVASFDVGDRTICRSAAASLATGRPLKISVKCDTAAVATMALVLPSREATGKPVLTLLKTTVLPSQTCLNEGPAQKTAVLTVASHLVSSVAGGANRFTERLGLQAWPAHLESLGQGVSSLELELPGGHCWPALRAETLLRMLDVVKDHGDNRAIPDVKVGERVDAACREVERLLSAGDTLEAYKRLENTSGDGISRCLDAVFA
ncbi:uncharacterized protein LOC119396663 isoform X2 [Rhipicephalus sanguineus]|uniref:uncharacterized protein LOC119396663 isoform X2 n=1 Tax=Rhipicephalus sanguineus TaxID=34632 RepID=UPI0020C33CDE|nr:uncharacterized protein LOC119396663 isoform X2 [Rhipicephalus sanguineus]